MQILLDTNIYILWLKDSPDLSIIARKMIDTASKVFVSAASITEASILIRNGSLDADIEMLKNEIKANDFKELSVSVAHAVLESLLPPIHSDTFDRILIAQAVCESLCLITSDDILVEYSELVKKV